LPTCAVPVSGIASPLREMSGAGDDRTGNARSIGGNPRDRLDVLYRDHAPKLRRRLRMRVGSMDEANDLVHDAFARLLGARALDELHEPAAFLNRIVRNLLIDRSRRQSARPPHVPLGSGVEIPVAPEQGADIAVDQMRRRYREIVDSLPPRMREVFVLHRVDGLSYKEIAARLDISVRTVEWHIAEAIVRIGRGLDSE
jgi:RNA polymerase sigma-70 factor (ECF subfamily)